MIVLFKKILIRYNNKEIYNLFIYFFQYLGKPWTVIGRAASLYTDPFIMLSGLLTSYSFIEKLKKNGNLNIKDEYLSRLIR